MCIVKVNQFQFSFPSHKQCLLNIGEDYGICYIFLLMLGSRVTIPKRDLFIFNFVDILYTFLDGKRFLTHY